MKKHFDAVIFDFDGTLMDSSAGIFESLRYAFEKAALPIPTDAELRRFIGPPIQESLRMFYGFGEEKIQFIIEKYRELYRETGYLHGEFYDGIVPLLKTLRENGIKTATASSKPVAFIEKILKHHGAYGLFDYVGGEGFDAPTSDKTALILNAMEALGLGSADRAVMVGDRKYDICGAKGAKVPCIAVLYGFGSRAEFEEYEAEYIAKDAEAVRKLILED